MKRKLPRRAVPVLFVAGLLLVALVGWLVVVSPQRSKASSLQKEIDDTRAQVLVLRVQPRNGAPREQLVKVADLFRLSKAVPDAVRMPDILLELSKVAGEAGITFDSITPQARIDGLGYAVYPVDIVFTGNYFGLSEFLYRLRNLVEVHDQRLVSTGRLFSVEQVNFSQGQGGFPNVEASLSVNAFVYTGMPAPGTAEGTTSTTSTATEPGTSAPAVAAAVPGAGS